MTLSSNDEYREALLWLITESGMSPSAYAEQVFMREPSTLLRAGRGWLKGGKIPKQVRLWIDAHVPTIERIREGQGA